MYFKIMSYIILNKIVPKTPKTTIVVICLTLKCFIIIIVKINKVIEIISTSKILLELGMLTLNIVRPADAIRATTALLSPFNIAFITDMSLYR